MASQTLNALIPMGISVADWGKALGQGVDIGNALIEGPYRRRLLAAQAAEAEATAANGGLTPYQSQELALNRERMDLSASQDKWQPIQVPGANGIPQTMLWNKTDNSIVAPSSLPGGESTGQRYRQMGVSDVTKLSEEGGKFSNIGGFLNSFQDTYAGYTPGTGSVAMTAGRYGYGTDNSKAAAGWWQGYDRYKNVVRHDLYGGALTPNETQQFEKADINPDMDPKQIRENLSTQAQIVAAGISRKANALVKSGYSPSAVYEAYGISGPQSQAAQPIAVAPSQAAPAARPVKTMNVAPDGAMTPTQAGEAPLNAPPVPGAMQPIQKDPRGPLYPPQQASAGGNPYAGKVFTTKEGSQVTYEQLAGWIQEARSKGIPEDRIRQKMIEMGIDPDQ